MRDKLGNISALARFTRKLSMLALLVILVFAILFVSIVVSGLFLYAFVHMGFLPPLTVSRLPASLAFLLLVSLLIGTLLAAFAGEHILRPLRRLAEAAKEVASGNFNVSVEIGGQNELSRLAENFNEMVRELSSIETLRTDFVSNISHEFKTPITSIRGFARRLKKGTLTDAQRHEYLDIILMESERLSRLSSNVLLLSRLEGADRVFEESVFYLDEQIRRSILLFEPQLQSKQLRVESDIETVRINANEEMLSHLWINLLENALKFSPPAATVSLTLRSSADKAVVTIADMGAGMDATVKARIFDKFYQGDPSRAAEGNGLGLSLVKRILELCGGTISVDSEPGKGACFTVTLPCIMMNTSG